MRRRVFCATAATAAVAGCLRLEEDGDDAETDPPQRDDGDSGSVDQGNDDPDEPGDDEIDEERSEDDEDEEDDGPDKLDLTEAWDGDVSHVYVDNDRFVGRDSPDVHVLSRDGELMWASESSDPDSYSVWPSGGRGFAETDEAVFIHYVSFGSGDAYDARIYAFDADDGTELWRHDTGDDRVTAMSATDDLLYYATRPFDRGEDTPVRALDIDSQSIVWERSLGGNRPSVLPIRGGSLYVPQETTFVLDPATGDTERELDVVSTGGSTRIDGDTLYLSGYDEIAALDLADETVEWTIRLDRHVNTGVSIADGIAYAGNDASYVLAHDIEADEPLWEHRVDGSVWNRPLVDDGVLWAYDDTSTVYAFDPTDGEPLYRRETEAQGENVATLDGRVYFPEPYYRAYDVERTE